jgi:hypothetical protein
VHRGRRARQGVARVVLFADAKAMEMEVRPVEADLQDDVKIGQGAVGSYEKATPEHRVDPPNPKHARALVCTSFQTLVRSICRSSIVDTVSFGLRIVFHHEANLSNGQRPRVFLAPGLKCSLETPER